MSYDLVPLETDGDALRETSEYRRTHYRVYDENGFLSTFDVASPESATLEKVSAHLCAGFAGTKGSGYDSKDMVVLLGSRIVAVVRQGEDGLPVVTIFEAE